MDFIIGNPPYQESYEGESKGANSIYNYFMDETYKIANKVELITPARFLFNAGSTPKAWNKKMLEDEHLKVLFYERAASKVFPNVDIKGGVAVTYRDGGSKFGKIGVFIEEDELRSIAKKVNDFNDFISLTQIIITSFAYHFTEKMHEDHPEAKDMMSKGHAYDLKSSSFERLPQIFLDEPKDDGCEYIKILGRENNQRCYKYVQRDYINKVSNLDKYKLFLPKANGMGVFGEVISSPSVEGPGTGATETFLSIGSFSTKKEATYVEKYIKTKFTRALLGILKATQDITPEKWKYVPLQDFSSSSDIDWSKSISEIDKQLYKKYKLSKEEIEFIESHVKEME